MTKQYEMTSKEEYVLLVRHLKALSSILMKIQNDFGQKLIDEYNLDCSVDDVADCVNDFSERETFEEFLTTLKEGIK